jgi:hypothetical protein
MAATEASSGEVIMNSPGPRISSANRTGMDHERLRVPYPRSGEYRVQRSPLSPQQPAGRSQWCCSSRPPNGQRARIFLLRYWSRDDPGRCSWRAGGAIRGPPAGCRGCCLLVAVWTVSHAPAQVTPAQVAQAKSAPAMTSRKKWFPVATTPTVDANAPVKLRPSTRAPATRQQMAVAGSTPPPGITRQSLTTPAWSPLGS